MGAVAASLVDQWSDPRWRLNNLYYITNKAGERELFKMNWAQEALFEDMHYLNVILKARQIGFTTFIQLFMLDACLFNSNVQAGVIAHTREDAEAIFQNKVKYPYDGLPEGLRAHRAATQDAARHLRFVNNSAVRVGTSLRSGTFQYLHVSEYGKICAKYPEKAREIRTGAFNTVQAGQFIFVESTAEGREGDFFDICEEAQSTARRDTDLTELDFKFHFFPWHRHPDYVMDAKVPLTREDKGYFDRLRQEEGIQLSAAQKAWYVKKRQQQGDDMKREFPSTPEEAFEASIEGAYYAAEMARMEEDGRIGPLPLDPSLPVETWWDLGMNDVMSIVWVQRVGPWLHFVDYHEDSGYGLGHYANVLRQRQQDRGIIYSTHIWPHDGNSRILDETGRKRTEVMRDLGYQVEVVARGLVDTGIEAVRNVLPRVRIDAERCDRLVKAAKSYRKEWDEDKGTFRNKPLHNWASHPADAIRTGVMYMPEDDAFDDTWDDADMDRSDVSGY